jgi:hypothetical protein
MIRMSGFDLETTGAKPETARIVQFGFAHVGGDQRPEVVECLVDPGVDVPEEAANIHGLTTEKVRAEGVNNVAAITQIVKQVTECVNNARPLVGHNISYDLTVLDRECRRHLGAPLETLVGAPVRPGINAAPIWVATPAQCTLSMLRQRLQAMGRKGYPPRLLVVDHVGLMSSTGRNESRYTEISAYARGLKLIAMEFDIPVVMLCQVNRGVGQRADAIPRVSDLRDSGELEQSSDMVVMVHRPDYDLADKENERAGEVDLYIAKNRSGPTAVVTLSSQLHYARFADMAQG